MPLGSSIAQADGLAPGVSPWADPADFFRFGAALRAATLGDSGMLGVTAGISATAAVSAFDAFTFGVAGAFEGLVALAGAEGLALLAVDAGALDVFAGPAGALGFRDDEVAASGAAFWVVFFAAMG